MMTGGGAGAGGEAETDRGDPERPARGARVHHRVLTPQLLPGNDDDDDDDDEGDDGDDDVMIMMMMMMMM